MGKVKVLSLFDGMGCGYLAMLGAGVEVDRYVAYEIDKYAIKVAKHNIPIIEHRGDVFDADFTEFEGFDFLVGGSPCTYWSIAQSPDKRETTSSGIGWELFSQYTRALRESQPMFFIYENNKSMSKDIRKAIDEAFGFEAVLINSALLSAQNRNRLYWVGKRNEQGGYDKVSIELPDDRGILLKDILDGAQGAGVNTQGKAHTLTASYEGACLWNTLERSQRSMVATPICIQGEKSQTLKAQYGKNSAQNGVEGGRTHGATMVAESTRGILDNDRIGGISHYTDGSFRPHRGDMKSTGISEIGKVHTSESKSYTITTNHSPTIITPLLSKGKKIYEVKNGRITIEIKGETRTYPIKLADGYYIIRKLSVSECMRLQTVPSWYDFSCVSNTQAYKCLGNGWTVDVITHLINSTLNQK